MRPTWPASLLAFLFTLMCLTTPMATHAEPPTAPPHGVLFEDLRVFDGTSEHLSEPVQVLVIGNAIVRIASEPIAPPPEVALSRILELRPAGCQPIYGAGAACRDGCGRKLGHLCHGACLHPARGPSGHRGGRGLNRSWPDAGRSHRAADRRARVSRTTHRRPLHRLVVVLAVASLPWLSPSSHVARR